MSQEKSGKPIKITNIHILAAGLIAEDKLTQEQIAAKCNRNVDTIFGQRRGWVVKRWFQELQRAITEKAIRETARRMEFATGKAYKSVMQLLDNPNPKVKSMGVLRFVQLSAYLRDHPIFEMDHERKPDAPLGGLHQTIVIQLPDNGRNKETCPVRPGEFQIEAPKKSGNRITKELEAGS
jgi:hypothetical protein